MEIGRVIETTRNDRIAIIELIAPLKKGDILRIEENEEPVESMQKDRQEVESASAGDAIGVLRKAPVRPNTLVYKINSNNKDNPTPL
ncbi:MAG: translation elongation factor-like protein [Candidatus Woesearchaeota archaeon]